MVIMDHLVSGLLFLTTIKYISLKLMVEGLSEIEKQIIEIIEYRVLSFCSYGWWRYNI